MLATQWLSRTNLSTRLVFAHGFTQNSRCWGTFGAACAEKFDVLAVDAPGHGFSGYDSSNLVEAGGLIVQAGGRGHYVGYSMGGRMLLHAALNNPGREIRSLTLIGAHGGIEVEEARVARRNSDAQLAARIVELGTQAFVDEWLAQPMFDDLTDEQSAKLFRYENAAEGMAASLRHAGTGSQTPLWKYLPHLQIPVLVIAGTRDERYTQVGQRMVDTIGSNARFVAIEGGHAVHLENPVVTAAVVSSWGDQLRDR